MTDGPARGDRRSPEMRRFDSKFNLLTGLASLALAIGYPLTQAEYAVDVLTLVWASGAGLGLVLALLPSVGPLIGIIALAIGGRFLAESLFGDSGYFLPLLFVALGAGLVTTFVLDTTRNRRGRVY